MKEFNKILEQDEKILWEGRPQFLPFFASSFITSIFGLPFLIIGAIVLITAIKAGNFLIFIFPHFWIGLVMVFGSPLYQILVYKYMYYAITNKGVLIQKGLIGRDFEMVDFDKITNADVRVDVIDKLLGKNSGSIVISTAGTFTYSRSGPVQKPYTFSHITSPYEVFKFFKKISYDMKADIEYPNLYRPETNPGYKTKYNTTEEKKD